MCAFAKFSDIIGTYELFFVYRGDFMYNYYFDLAAIIVFIIVIGMVVSTKHILDYTFRILCTLTGTAFVATILDLLRIYMINNRMHTGFVVGVNVLFFTAHMVVIFLFLMYVVSQVEMSETRTLVRKFILYAPLVVCLVMIVLTPFYNLVFHYTSETGYSSGPLHFLVYAVPAGYFIWAVIYSIKYRRYLDRSFIIMIIHVVIVNLFSGVCQATWPYLSIRTFLLSMTAVIMYFFEEQRRVTIEPDTNLVGKEYLAEVGGRMVLNKYPFAIILIKMSNFDALSDTFGHSNTTALGKNIASCVGGKYRLGKCFRISEATIAVLNTEVEKTNDIMKELYDELSDSWEIEGMDIFCDILMTVCRYPDDATDPENITSIIRHFDKLERNVGGIIDIDELHINEQIRIKQVENAIERGLNNNSFEVYYQPIHSLENDTFVTAEALIRLTDSELGPVSPAEFIPIAENNGTIVAIGNYVLETVCKFISENDMEQLGLHYIELNLSVIQCLQKDFIDTIESIVGKYDIDPKYLCLEVTETASNYSPAVFKQNLETLGEKGYSLALDDFGTGYANIERMVTSNFRIIKFDKEMTQYSSSEERLQKVFEKLQNVVHSMDSQVVAEGVETKDQYEYLKAIGCDYIQGYYFSKPVPQDEFVEFIKANN